MDKAKEFLIMLLESIEGGGRVVTFQDFAIEELKRILEEWEQNDTLSKNNKN